ncbi:protein-tyrosine sulfotransferase A-like [Lycorma delicatula]|uniref:protein-tyrosine sulfotransferase A-like n=1 Tax=Lycorma delicatula TaxID=130591 RepID=UPI003F5128CB
MSTCTIETLVVERSSDQVIKQVNLKAITKWVGQIPKDVVKEMEQTAPMLSLLFYDPHANLPNYGSPDAFVADNTKRYNYNMSSEQVERSSDQVIKQVNLKAITKWVGQIPKDVVKEMEQTAVMLSLLFYDPHANLPNYGSPDAFVADNTKRIKAQSKIWKEKAQEI